MKSVLIRKLKYLAAGVTAVAIGIMLANLVAAPAVSAADTQWKAGRIIDDSVFYDKNGLNAGQIQTFLDSKVPDCDTNGEEEYRDSGMTRAQWAEANNKPTPPYTCLKDASFNTTNKSPDEFCNGHSSGNKSSARIIYEVAQSCDVNPKALIVLLQKEQALITDDWPWPVQYQKATGYACPDTAPCDSQYFGFFNQVYNAARQFKRYRAYPHNYNHIAGIDNNVRFHPNASCGSSTVRIQNQATAGLYNYTPYQPNQAALDAGFGTGNSCSSYGNRNFWLYFLNWFGNPRGPGYATKVESYTVYSDSARTTRISDRDGVSYIEPGQTVYVRAEFQNYGRIDWQQDQVKLGTTSPRDRSSIFSNGSWLSSGRATYLSENTVEPNSNGTFDFSMTAPSNPGVYSERFGLLREGITWFSGDSLSIPIVVATPESPGSGSNNTLQSDNELSIGDRLATPDNNGILQLQPSGNLILTVDFNRAWSSGTAGSGANRAVLQGDGNFVLYAPGKGAVWSTGTHGNGQSVLTLQDDGNVAINRTSDDQLTWETQTGRFGDIQTRTNFGLRRGDLLLPGQKAITPDRKNRLSYQGDGNLVLYSPNGARWSSGTNGTSAGKIALQGDGNLVIYNGQGRPIWSSGTNGQRVSKLSLQMNSNLVLKGSRGVAWSSATGDSYSGEPFLDKGARLRPGDRLISPNGVFNLAMQGDGNLVLYRSGNALWSTGTNGNRGASLHMQGDGNLVLYRSGRSLWSTSTNGNGGATFNLQNDGNLVIYQNAKAIWSTGRP